VTDVSPSTEMCPLTCHYFTVCTTTSTTKTTALWPFVWDYPSELASGETFTHTPILIINHPLSPSSIYYDL